MSYLVLARKWRPQSFGDIAGQGHITRTLQNAIRTKRIAHAYLFTGVRGVGKTTAARILAKALNCDTGPTPEPCNQCSQCAEITAGNSIDVLEIDGASNRGIDEVRQIIEGVRYQPAKSRFKIYIIDEVHQVTKDAFNALLKTLEEPPPSVKFVLATTEPHRLPETILSRCQRFDFRRIALREVVQRLSDIAAKEGLKISDGALVLLAREADGSMRDAQSLLEQVLACAESRGSGEQPAVDEGLLQDLLGLAERGALYALSAAVLRGDAKACIEIIAAATTQGRDLCRLSRDLVEHFRNLLVARLVEAKAAKSPAATDFHEQLLDLPDQEIADLTSQAEGLTVETLLDYFDFMAAGDEEVARAANSRFALEAVLVRLASLPRSLPAAELLERLERLETRLSAAAPPVSNRPAAPADTKAVNAVTDPPEELGADASNDEAWRNFVAFVGKEKKLLATHLETTRPLEMLPNQLRIGVGERHHLGYLQDSESLSALKALAKRFFSREVTIQFTPMAPASTSGGADQAATAGTESESDKVNQVLRIFGGTVKTVRRENG